MPCAFAHSNFIRNSPLYQEAGNMPLDSIEWNDFSLGIMARMNMWLHLSFHGKLSSFDVISKFNIFRLLGLEFLLLRFSFTNLVVNFESSSLLSCGEICAGTVRLAEFT